MDNNIVIPENLLNRLSSIENIVGNLNEFRDRSRLDKLLKMNLTVSGVTLDNVIRYLTNTDVDGHRCDNFSEKSSPECAASLRESLVILPDILDSILPETTLTDNILTDINNFQTPGILSNISEENQVVKDNHLSLTARICYTIFNFHYKQLFANISNFNLRNVGIPSLSNESLSNVATDYIAFINTISTNFDNFNKTNINDYYHEVYFLLNNYRNTRTGISNNVILFNLFMSCYYSYLLHKYIIGQIAYVQSTSPEDNANRYFILRRKAILSCYKLEFNILLIIFANCTVGNKTNAERLLLMMYDTMELELQSTNENTYVALIEENKINVNSSKDLQEKTRNITLSKNNLFKAEYNVKNINKEYKNSFVYMWLWIGFFILYVILSSILIFFLNTNSTVMSIYYIFNLLLFGAIVIMMLIKFVGV